MIKKFVMMNTLIGLLMLLIGCDSLGTGNIPTMTEYQVWRNSDAAEDLNGDRKIDELDYELYLIRNDYNAWINSDYAEDLNDDRKIDELDYEIYLIRNVYEVWRNSEFAEDLNGDRKIDELDFEIFLNPTVSEYDIWKDSEEAEDLNNDGNIDEADYEIYQDLIKLSGYYQIINFSYEGYNMKIGDQNDIESMGEHLAQILISITPRGIT